MDVALNLQAQVFVFSPRTGNRYTTRLEKSLASLPSDYSPRIPCGRDVELGGRCQGIASACTLCKA